MEKISNSKVLNEASEYGATFSRGVRVNLGTHAMLYVSGTASINEKGESCHENDFINQAHKCFDNVKELLKSENATWKDVVKTTIYIKDIETNYNAFNVVRKLFFESEGIDIYPASVCVQATLCRPELMIEMDAIAVLFK